MSEKVYIRSQILEHPTISIAQKCDTYVLIHASVNQKLSILEHKNGLESIFQYLFTSFWDFMYTFSKEPTHIPSCKISGIASVGSRGAECPLDSKKSAKNWEKIRKKRKNSFLLTWKVLVQP